MTDFCKVQVLTWLLFGFFVCFVLFFPPLPTKRIWSNASILSIAIHMCHMLCKNKIKMAEWLRVKRWYSCSRETSVIPHSRSDCVFFTACYGIYFPATQFFGRQGFCSTGIHDKNQQTVLGERDFNCSCTE